MTRTIANPTRGCGHLKRGKGYIKGCIGSPNGVLPSFVRAEPFIPFREAGTDGEFTRGFLELNGVGFEAAAQDDLTDFVPVYPGDTNHEAAVTNMVDRGQYRVRDDVPEDEYQRHLDRIAAKAGDGADHFGDVGIRASNDLLMRVGKTHYSDPDDYIQETIEYGLSKAIPLSKRQEPPRIEPGLTRVWVVHPDVDGVGWAVLGFCYVQEVVFTEPADGNIPAYIQDYQAAGKLDVVDIAPPEGADEDDSPNGDLDDYLDSDDAPQGQDPDGQNPAEQAIERGDPWGSMPDIVVPSDSDGVDVEALDLSDPDVGMDDVVDAAGSGGDAEAQLDARIDDWRDWWDDQDPSGRYNHLKQLAAYYPGVDVSAQPSADELFEAMALAGISPGQATQMEAAKVGTGPGDGDV